MKILVCVKQVPDTTEIKIDPVKNTLIREGVPSILNPYDGYALEAAARIKDKHPDTEIVVVSMGPEQAKKALKECLAIAADRAYLLSDRAFGGADTLATSYTISTAIRAIEEKEGKFDAVFCGKQAIDGDTAQVGPGIAEHLGYPQVTCGLEAELEGDMLKISRETDEGKAVIGVKLPCLVTLTKPAWEPRLPNIKRKLKANKADIPVLTASDIPNIDLSLTGLRGSPTRVKKTFVPQKKKNGILIKEKDDSASALELYRLLHEAKLF